MARGWPHYQGLVFRAPLDDKLDSDIALYPMAGSRLRSVNQASCVLAILMALGIGGGVVAQDSGDGETSRALKSAIDQHCDFLDSKHREWFGIKLQAALASTTAKVSPARRKWLSDHLEELVAAPVNYLRAYERCQEDVFSEDWWKNTPQAMRERVMLDHDREIRVYLETCTEYAVVMLRLLESHVLPPEKLDAAIQQAQTLSSWAKAIALNEMTGNEQVEQMAREYLESKEKWLFNAMESPWNGLFVRLMTPEEMRDIYKEMRDGLDRKALSEALDWINKAQDKKKAFAETANEILANFFYRAVVLGIRRRTLPKDLVEAGPALIQRLERLGQAHLKWADEWYNRASVEAFEATRKEKAGVDNEHIGSTKSKAASASESKKPREEANSETKAAAPKNEEKFGIGWIVAAIAVLAVVAILAHAFGRQKNEG